MFSFPLFLFLSYLSLIDAHFRDPRIATFAIAPDSQHTITVVNGNTGQCTFSYTTTTQLQTTKSINTKININNIVSHLYGTCIKNRKEYWEYELCFGQSMIQSHAPDKFNLGKKAEIVGNTQVYKDGDYCAPIKNGRQTKVNFFCSTTADSPELVTVRESSTCVYEADVALAKVCGDPAFGYMSSDPSIDLNTEDWYLEISQLTNGHILCQVYSLEYRSTGSKLHFEKFELKASNTAVATKDQDTNLLSQATARHPGRRSCSSSEISSSPGHISATSEFDGSLAFARVYA